MAVVTAGASAAPFLGGAFGPVRGCGGGKSSTFGTEGDRHRRAANVATATLRAMKPDPSNTAMGVVSCAMTASGDNLDQRTVKTAWAEDA
jgi:hypothetical protein